MSNGLLLLSIGLTALAGSICTLMYSRMHKLTETIQEQFGQITRLDSVLRDVVIMQTSTQHCVSELSAEMQLRGVYKNAGDRHKLAIHSAKSGKNRAELMMQHGLSSDEASLIISLHGTVSEKNPRQNSYDRHELAIKAAKIGKNRTELIGEYGLSNDEASLIVSLHGSTIDYDLSSVSVKTQSPSKESELTEA